MSLKKPWGVLVGFLCLPGLAPAAPPGGGHGFHVPMPDQEIYLAAQCAGNPAGTIEKVIPLGSTMAACDVHEVLALPCLNGPIRARKYLPQARREQEVKRSEEEGAAAAVLLHIEGRKQDVDRWLVAGDPERNRLTSLVGTWRFMEVRTRQERDELYAAFQNELSRPPKIQITRDGSDEVIEIPARRGATTRLDGNAAQIEVLQFYPHFAVEGKSSQPVNQSDELVNPAALVRISLGKSREERWLFAKFPGFSDHGEAHSPIRMRLDCPLARTNAAPDFALVAIDRQKLEVWTRHGGKTASRIIEPMKSVSIPDSTYSFRIDSFVPSGRLEESYRPTEERSAAVTALMVELPSEGGKQTTLWLELGKVRTVQTSTGPVTLTFSSRSTASRGAPWSHR